MVPDFDSEGPDATGAESALYLCGPPEPRKATPEVLTSVLMGLVDADNPSVLLTRAEDVDLHLWCSWEREEFSDRGGYRLQYLVPITPGSRNRCSARLLTFEEALDACLCMAAGGFPWDGGLPFEEIVVEGQDKQLQYAPGTQRNPYSWEQLRGWMREGLMFGIFCTPEEAERNLDALGRTPETLTAAVLALHGGEDAWLEEALELNPDWCPALMLLANESVRKPGSKGASLLERWRRADPGNILVACFEAWLRFHRGDVSGAQEVLLGLTSASFYTDYSLALHKTQQDWFQALGNSPGVSGLLASNDPLGPEPRMLRELVREIILRASRLSRTGQWTAAGGLLDSLALLGRAFHDGRSFHWSWREHFGCDCQIRALQGKRRLRRAQNCGGLTEPEAEELRRLREERAHVAESRYSVRSHLLELTEEQLAEYVSRAFRDDAWEATGSG